MIRALIADDESLARRGLRARLGAFDDIEIVAETADGETTAQAIEEHRPDVVFLDIEMPQRQGTEVARSLDANGRPAIVFVSAHSEYAVDAFEIQAIDYLVKPVTAARLRNAVERLRSTLGTDAAGNDASGTLKVRDGERTTLLPIAEIDYVHAAGDYMVIHAGDATMIHRTTMTQLMNELAAAGITRIHRSTLVAVDRIRAVERCSNGSGHVVLADGTRLKYSRSFRAALGAQLGLAVGVGGSGSAGFRG